MEYIKIDLPTAQKYVDQKKQVWALEQYTYLSIGRRYYTRTNVRLYNSIDRLYDGEKICLKCITSMYEEKIFQLLERSELPSYNRRHIKELEFSNLEFYIEKNI